MIHGMNEGQIISEDSQLITARPDERAHLGFIFKGENESTGVPNISSYQ